MRKEIVQKANLYYCGIDRMPEAGLPIGNGRMGTLIWLSENAVHLQINRCDVFGCDGSSTSFSRADTDYAHGCAFIDIRFPGWRPVFGAETRQELDVYTGCATIRGDDVALTLRFDMDADLLMAEIDDRRENAIPAEVHLRTLRAGSQYIPGARPQKNPSLHPEHMTSYVVTGKHVAASTLSLEEPSLHQEFKESDYICESHVALRFIGWESIARFHHFTDLCLTLKPGKNKGYLAIASASGDDSAADCRAVLDRSEKEPAEAFRFRCISWWREFWESAPYIDMTSADGAADRIARDVCYFQYIMACVSRGKYAARFGGLLFKTNGDYVMRGSQFWWHNQSCYYNALIALGMFSLASAQLDQISDHLSAYAQAARQQWGADGIWIPETVWFNGPADLDDDLAQEMRLLYTLEKPWDERSARFRDAAEGRNTFESRWNWIEHDNNLGEFSDKGYGPFGHVTHIFSTTAKIAWLFWQQYRVTLDEKWLSQRAYPVIRGAAQFYCTMPLLKYGPDGMLHFYHVNNHESCWDCSDSISEMAAIHGILPIAIRSAEILGADTELCEAWKKVLNHLAPLVTNRKPGALGGYRKGDPEIWAPAAEPCQMGHGGNQQDPFYFYDLVTLETPIEEPDIPGNTYRNLLDNRYSDRENGHIHVLDKICTVAARRGDAETVRQVLPAQLEVRDPSDDFCDWEGSGYTAVLENRLTLREGPQAIGCQRIGRVAEGLVNAVCSSVPAQPGGSEVLHLFPAAPKSWDIMFSLPTRGGLHVKGEQKEGQVRWIEITASVSGMFSLRDPWSGELRRLILNSGESVKFSAPSERKTDTGIS